MAKGMKNAQNVLYILTYPFLLNQIKDLINLVSLIKLFRRYSPVVQPEHWRQFYTVTLSEPYFPQLLESNVFLTPVTLSTGR